MGNVLGFLKGVPCLMRGARLAGRAAAARDAGDHREEVSWLMQHLAVMSTLPDETGRAGGMALSHQLLFDAHLVHGNTTSAVHHGLDALRLVGGNKDVRSRWMTHPDTAHFLVRLNTAIASHGHVLAERDARVLLECLRDATSGTQTIQSSAPQGTTGWMKGLRRACQRGRVLLTSITDGIRTRRGMTQFGKYVAHAAEACERQDHAAAIEHLRTGLGRCLPMLPPAQTAYLRVMAGCSLFTVHQAAGDAPAALSQGLEVLEILASPGRTSEAWFSSVRLHITARFLNQLRALIEESRAGLTRKEEHRLTLCTARARLGIN